MLHKSSNSDMVRQPQPIKRILINKCFKDLKVINVKMKPFYFLVMLKNLKVQSENSCSPPYLGSYRYEGLFFGVIVLLY